MAQVSTSPGLFGWELPDECTDDSNLSANFVPPMQIVLEFLVIHAIIVPTVWSLWEYKVRDYLLGKHPAYVVVDVPEDGQPDTAVESADHMEIVPFQHVIPPRNWVEDCILLLLLGGSYAIVFTHKLLGSKMAFLLQPCHMFHLILIAAILSPPRSMQAQALFTIFLSGYGAPFMGMVGVDLSCYTMFFEAANWFIQHFLLLAVPLYLIYRNRISPPRSLLSARFCLVVLLIHISYHFSILTVASTYSGHNINFMMCPPKMSIFRVWGQYYRTFGSIFASGVFFLMRFLVLTPASWLISKFTGGAAHGLHASHPGKPKIG